MEKSHKKLGKYHFIFAVILPVIACFFVPLAFGLMPEFINAVIAVWFQVLIVVGINFKFWNLQNLNISKKEHRLLRFYAGITRSISIFYVVVPGFILLMIELYVSNYPSYSVPSPMLSRNDAFLKAVFLFSKMAIIYVVALAVPVLLAYSSYALSKPICLNNSKNRYYYLGLVSGIAVIVISWVIALLL